MKWKLCINRFNHKLIFNLLIVKFLNDTFLDVFKVALSHRLGMGPTDSLWTKSVSGSPMIVPQAKYLTMNCVNVEEKVRKDGELIGIFMKTS